MAAADLPDVFPEPVVAAIRRGETSSDLIGALSEIIAAVRGDDMKRLCRDEVTPGAAGSDAVHPVVRAVSMVFMDAYTGRASDIHFDPMENGALLVRFRSDGVMQDHKEFPIETSHQVINRLKLMAGLNISEKRLPQDGRIKITIKEKPLDLRVSVIGTVHGERITIRLLRGDMINNCSLEKLDMGADELQKLRRIFAGGGGIVICSGPTSSGKTTVLYSMLSEMNDGRRAIFSVEHQVEYFLAGVSQIAVQPHIGLTFSSVMRSVFRQAPDVVMISEICDSETLQLAVQGGLNGQLILTALHTNSAVTALKRLVDLGLEPFLIGDTVRAISNQRLVRTLCADCRRPAAVPTARLPKDVAALADAIKDAQFHEPVGCGACNGTGYRGRTGIYEVLFMSENLKHTLYSHADEKHLGETAREDGMRTMLCDGIQKAAAGITSIPEVMRATASCL